MKIGDLVMKSVEEDLTWFLGKLGGKVPAEGDATTRAAAERVAGWLRQVSPIHRGVLLLRFTPRAWPDFIVEEFGPLASVAVRLECALHPAVGVSVEALEQASVERIHEELREGARARARRRPSRRADCFTAAEERIERLQHRAFRHVRLALRAVVKVRGLGLCRAPEKVAP